MFHKSYRKVFFYKSHSILKLYKNFECSCANGFTGDFCEFKTEQDDLLFVHEKTQLVFNDGKLIDEKLIEKNALIDKQAGAYGSGSTILNGEAIIFGGWNSLNIERQVNLK